MMFEKVLVDWFVMKVAVCELVRRGLPERCRCSAEKMDLEVKAQEDRPRVNLISTLQVSQMAEYRLSLQRILRDQNLSVRARCPHSCRRLWKFPRFPEESSMLHLNRPS